MIDRMTFHDGPGIMRGSSIEILQDGDTRFVEIQRLRPGQQLCLDDGCVTLQEILMYWCHVHYCVELTSGDRVKVGPKTTVFLEREKQAFAENIQPGQLIQYGTRTEHVASVKKIGTAAPLYHLRTLRDRVTVNVRGIWIVVEKLLGYPAGCCVNPVETHDRVRLPAGFG